MKFKLKILKNINNPNDFYWKIVTLEEILYKGIKEEFFLIDGSYRLITKISDVEIYEYDCYYDKESDTYFYFYYESNGLLRCNFYCPLRKLIINPFMKITAMTDFEKELINYNFIGNCHDGEYYILDKIKELNNE